MCTDRRRLRALLPRLCPPHHSHFCPSSLAFPRQARSPPCDYYPTQSVVLYATPRHRARKVSRSFPRTPCQTSPLRLPSFYPPSMFIPLITFSWCAPSSSHSARSFSGAHPALPLSPCRLVFFFRPCDRRARVYTG